MRYSVNILPPVHPYSARSSLGIWMFQCWRESLISVLPRIVYVLETPRNSSSWDESFGAISALARRVYAFLPRKDKHFLFQD